LVSILGTPDDVVIEVVCVASSMDDIWLIIPEFVFNYMSCTFFSDFSSLAIYIISHTELMFTS
jgi:hypothetical protein